MAKKKMKPKGFYWSEESTYLKSWSEPVFAFKEGGRTKEVGLGAFSPGKVQGFSPNSNPNRENDFFEAVEKWNMAVYFNEVPKAIAKMILDFLAPEEKEYLRAKIKFLNYQKRKKVGEENSVLELF